MLSFIRYFVVFQILALNMSLANTDPIAKTHDTDLPIEITAEHFEINQTDRLAIFTGDVLAIQGDIDLRSQKMIVYYSKEAADQPQSITKVQTIGDVIISTDAKTVVGNNGLYEVDKKQMIVTGDVIVKDGTNEIMGDKLVYDFTNGSSKMESASTQSSGKNNSKKKRVKALLIPSNE